MPQIFEKMFTNENLACPVCGLCLVPSASKYCDHIAFYCLQGPTDDPFLGYPAVGGGDTIIRVENSDGEITEFADSEEYLDYFEKH